MKRLQLNDLAPRLLNDVELTPTGDSGILMPQTEIYTPQEAEKLELGLEKILDDVLTSSSRVPPDLRIDDRDIKEFPNFYSFAFSKQGLDQAPFSRQLAIATWLFAEHCPDCTKSKAIKTYNIHGIPVDFPAQDFPDRVQFLHHGKCPKCGKHRVDFFKSGQLRPYYEFTGCLGQRAGKSALLGQLAPYMLHRWLKLQRPVEALGLMKSSILVGTMVALTWQKAMELLFQPFMNAIHDSPWFCIEENQPITLVDGSTKPIKDIAVGDSVKTLEGESIVDRVFDNGYQEVFELTLESGHTLQATKEHKIRCLVDGRIEWVTLEDLTDEHEVVIED